MNVTSVCILGLLAGSAASPITALPVPELFASGAISGPQNDGAPTFTRNGQTLYFERSYGRRSAIYVSTHLGSRWTNAKLASFSGTSDQHPALSSDDRAIVYVSRRVKKQPDGTVRRVSHLWEVTRTGIGWGAPVELPSTVNISDRVFRPTVAANGDLYFMSAQKPEGAELKWRLYRSVRVGSSYAEAEPLPFSDERYSDVDPLIAQDQSFIIFSSQGRPGADLEHERLYFAERRGEGWGPVVPLRYGNEEWGGSDGEPSLSPDYQWLYFTSDRTVPLTGAERGPAVEAEIRRAELWENGNGNVWRVPFAELLKANHIERPVSRTAAR